MDIAAGGVSGRGGMGKFTIALVLVIVMALLGCMAFLAFWNPPAPSAPIQKVIPNEHFPK
jgi:hypothetical protein